MTDKLGEFDTDANFGMIPTEIDAYSNVSNVANQIILDNKEVMNTTKSGKDFAQFAIDYTKRGMPSRGMPLIEDFLDIVGINPTGTQPMDTYRPTLKGLSHSKSFTCAYCVSKIGEEYGVAMPDNPEWGYDLVQNADQLFQMIEGTDYAKQQWGDSEFMIDSLYNNWIIIDDPLQIKAGDLLKFEGSGPSSLHAAWSVSDYNNGLSIVDDRGSKYLTEQRWKDDESFTSSDPTKKQFIRAYRPVY